MRNLPLTPWITLLAPLALLAFLSPTLPAQELRPLETPSYLEVQLTGPWFGKRLESWRDRTIPHNLAECESTGRIQNLEIAAGKAEGEFQGYFFNDSDLYKVIEGAAYLARLFPEKYPKQMIDDIVDTIAKAQQDDGYLNSWVQVTKEEPRWSNTRVRHELYCAGHLFEAAVALHEATQDERLLDVALKLAAHIEKEFGPKANTSPPGHQEIELALIRLARHTKDPRWTKLAKFFLEARGRKLGGRELYGEYSQDHLPIREQKEAVGHAVRAMYQYCGIFDLAIETQDESLIEALRVLWDDVTTGKMYITGAVGAVARHEGFADSFELPNDEAYCESCASIGMVMWSHRMALLERDAKYADVMERVLYNGFSSGISVEGDRFFYVNPLASRGGHERKPWYKCACCPTNYARMIPRIAERVWAKEGDTLYALLYEPNILRTRLAGQKIQIETKGEFPFNGDVRIQISLNTPMEFTLALRKPGWVDDARERAVLYLNGEQFEAPNLERGFWKLRREWKNGDTLRILFPMWPVRMYSDDRVTTNRDHVALLSGPLVLAVHEGNNSGHARNLSLPKDAKFDYGRVRPEQVLKMGTMTASGLARFLRDDPSQVHTKPHPIRAIPYALWPGGTAMRVWIPEKPELSEISGATDFEKVGTRLVGASHCYQGDSVRAILDGKLPKNSNDHDIPRHTFWPRRGSKEWVRIHVPLRPTLSQLRVYWFDDSPKGGGCRVPASWRVLVRKDNRWQPVQPLPDSSYGTKRDAWQEIRFTPVSTNMVQIEIQLQKDMSAGILELELK
jgi:DUF1680 family protein